MEKVRATLFSPRKAHQAPKLPARKNKTARDLWGCCRNTRLSNKDFRKLKDLLKPIGEALGFLPKRPSLAAELLKKRKKDFR